LHRTDDRRRSKKHAETKTSASSLELGTWNSEEPSTAAAQKGLLLWNNPFLFENITAHFTSWSRQHDNK
jgi:hypothetical protein